MSNDKLNKISNGVNDERELIKSVSRVTRALWTRNIIEQTLRLGFYGTIVSIILILLVKFSSLLNWASTSFCFIPLTSGILLGLLLGLVRKPRLNETALFLDRACSLQNRLATLLEHIKRPSSSPLVSPLLSDTMQYRTQFLPAIVYKHFNTNYLFQYLLAGLGIIILCLIPVPHINYVRGDIAREQSEKLKATAQDICQSDELDGVAHSLTNEMEGIARAIEEGKINPEETIQKLESLSEKVRKQIHYCETGRELISKISLVLGKTPPHDTPNLDPDYMKKMLQDLQDQIRQGRMVFDVMEALKQALSQAKNAVQDDLTLKQLLDEGINALETPEANLTPALQKFFDTVGRKNRALLERILTRLSIASKEITQVAKPADNQTSKSSDSQSNLSRAPLHPTHSDTSDPFEIPLTSNMTAEKIALINEVIKHRESALNKPHWPPEYDEIIRQYFSESR